MSRSQVLSVLSSCTGSDIARPGETKEWSPKVPGLHPGPKIFGCTIRKSSMEEVGHFWSCRSDHKVSTEVLRLKRLKVEVL